MSLITRILLLALALPYVLAHNDGDNNKGCGNGQFKWDAKNICLTLGGPSKPSKPPANTDCPFNWSWNTGKGCCAPHKPPNTLPPPQCSQGWNWSPGSLCCNKPPTTPTTTKPPTPSQTPGKPDCDDDKDNNGKGGKGGDDDNQGRGHGKRLNVSLKKREFRSRSLSPCPKGLSACPVTSLIGGDYECVDTLVELDNCGGCATLGEGQNCNAIPGVWNVGCEQSACKIYTCAEGYILSKDGNSCNPL